MSEHAKLLGKLAMQGQITRGSSILGNLQQVFFVCLICALISQPVLLPDYLLALHPKNVLEWKNTGAELLDLC